MTGQNVEKASVSESERVCWTPSSHRAWLNLWLSSESSSLSISSVRSASSSSMFEKQRASSHGARLNLWRCHLVENHLLVIRNSPVVQHQHQQYYKKNMIINQQTLKMIIISRIFINVVKIICWEERWSLIGVVDQNSWSADPRSAADQPSLSLLSLSLLLLLFGISYIAARQDFHYY